MNESTVKNDKELEKVLSEISFVHTVLDFKWRFESRPIVLSGNIDGQPLAGSQKEGWLVSSFQNCNAAS